MNQPTELSLSSQFLLLRFGNYRIDDQQIVGALLNRHGALFEGHLCVVGHSGRCFHPLIARRITDKVLGTIAIRSNANDTRIGQQHEQEIASAWFER